MLYYEILEISQSATEDEIKKAYKKLALRWHPDKNGGSAEAVEKPCVRTEKRQLYDRYGESGLSGAGVRDEAPEYAYAHQRPFQFQSPEEIFRQFFGGRDPFADFFGSSSIYNDNFGFPPRSRGSGFRTTVSDPFEGDPFFGDSAFEHGFGGIGGGRTGSTFSESGMLYGGGSATSFSFSSSSSAFGGGGSSTTTKMTSRIVNGRNMTTKVTEIRDAQGIKVIEDFPDGTRRVTLNGVEQSNLVEGGGSGPGGGFMYVTGTEPSTGSHSVQFQNTFDGFGSQQQQQQQQQQQFYDPYGIQEQQQPQQQRENFPPRSSTFPPPQQRPYPGQGSQD
ncbi:DnaJ domain-containing protein [Jimgerdemannia flammicorona]|uniref:DnaJ domain-containing protein n=1 Tax=Jimgerdemannia flammicorona TaxID=994334 RepID=A0A433QNH4_9FUNG|nr:DnaJ domain-containing protein [Jimgerdemannia flammicorona]